MKIFVRMFLVVAAVFAATSAGAKVVPKPYDTTPRVYDYGKVLDDGTRASLDQRLQGVSTAKVVVVTVESLDGQTVEDYANDLFKLWGLGEKKVDNGVLFLVAKIDRKMRIETGYGMEGILPDVTCKQILRDTVKPFLQKNDWAGGISAGVYAIIGKIAPTGAVTSVQVPKVEEISLWTIVIIVVIVVLVLLFLLFISSGSGGSYYSGSSSSGSWGGGGWGGGGGGSSSSSSSGGGGSGGGGASESF